MKNRFFVFALGLISVMCSFSSSAAFTSVNNHFVRLDQNIPGVLYQPVQSGPKSHIAIMVMHAAADYLNFAPCTELSKRGYTVLCANNNTPDYDQKILAVKTGVQFLRHYPGIQKVILFGHSGGSGLMSAYQNIAENGVKVCQTSDMVYPCSNQLAGLPPADGVMLIDPNWGDATMMLLSVDPAVTHENSGLKLNPAFDIFSPKHGFTPQGAHYTAAFIKQYQHAQVLRYNRILKYALNREQALKQGKALYQDDEPLLIPGGASQIMNNKLYPQDPSLMSHTIGAWPLLHADGSVETTIVHTVRKPVNLDGSVTGQMNIATLSTTVRNYLKNFAIKVDDDFSYDATSIHGVDWSSNYSTSAGNVKGISVPLLTMGMTGSWEYLSVETIFNNAKSKDKSIAFVEGANHLYQTCTTCEQYPGQYGDTVTTLFNHIDQWISKPGRFM